MKQRSATFLLLAVLFVLSACAGDSENKIQTQAKYPTGADRDGSTDSIYDKPSSIFGPGGLSLGGKDKDNEDGASGIGVNSFLWRASLDTVSFMPLASADPFGGTILTDWYTPDESGKERYKLNVFILGRQLRSDGVRVRVFRQDFRNGAWKDVQPPDDMARKLEDAILTRARQLRIAQVK